MKCKRLFAAILAVAMCAGILAACTPGDSGETNSNSFDFGSSNGFTFSQTDSEGGGESTGTDETPSGASSSSSKQDPVTSNTKPVDAEGMVVAKVQMKNGTPRLMIDGKEVIPTMVSVNVNSTEEGVQTALRQIEKAKKGGVNLVNIGIDVNGVRYVSMYVDKLYKLCKRIYDVNPDAKLILRFAVNNTPQYVNVDDSALATINNGAIACNYCSLASDVWLEGAKKMARSLAQVVMSDEFIKKMVIAYQPAAGDAGEWFGPEYWNGGLDTSASNLSAFRNWLKAKYKNNQALQKAWGDSSVTLSTVQLPHFSDVPGMMGGYSSTEQFIMTDVKNQHMVDYLTYSNYRRAEVISEIGGVIKEETGGNSLVIFLYSYHTEVYNPSSNSFGVNYILESDNVDGFAGPVSYGDRNEGGIGAYMPFASAIAAAGKLWIDEGDYRTVYKTAEGINPVGGNQDGVGDSMPFIKTEAGVMEVLKRQQGKQMVYSTGTWYFDLVERGWFDSQDFWDQAGDLNALQMKYQSFRKENQFDVAIVMDERAMALSGDGSQNVQLLANSRQTIYRSGLSFGYFLIDDVLEGRVNAKLYVMMNPWDISEAEAEKLKKVLHKKGVTTLWMTGAGDTSSTVFNSLTGMKITAKTEGKYSNSIETVSNAATLLPGLKNTEEYSGVGANPLYCVAEESGVTVLGKYATAAGRPVGYAMTTKDGWTSIFYGNANLTFDVLLSAAKKAGACVYVKNQSASDGDVVYANNTLAVLHTKTQGSKTVSFPKGTEAVYEAFSKKWYSGDEVTITAQKETTYYFFYGKKSELQKAGIGK
ncbi:MAG: hypothetical protein E7486_01810 [Ruminococcaceae bacterium]|nr:hypothetical protein [Oscillospiraceae bacterium]